MDGWDEILDPDLPKDIVIQSWRGQKSLAESARHGFFEHPVWPATISITWSRPPRSTRWTRWIATPPRLADEENARILGGEVAMWGEFVSPENVDSRIWPRAAAVAERLWSPQEVKDVPSMYRRLDAVSGELDRLGLTHLSSYVRCSNGWPPGIPWNRSRRSPTSSTPATFGQRIRTHKYTQQTPLNDWWTPLVPRAKPRGTSRRWWIEWIETQIRVWLTRWRDNDARLKPLLERSDLLREDIPVSEDLSRLATIGLQALDYSDRAEHPPDAWLAQQRAFLETCKKPQAELRLAIVPSIEKLLNAAASTP